MNDDVLPYTKRKDYRSLKVTLF